MVHANSLSKMLEYSGDVIIKRSGKFFSKVERLPIIILSGYNNFYTFSEDAHVIIRFLFMTARNNDKIFCLNEIQ